MSTPPRSGDAFRIVLYLVSVLALGALLAPALYDGGKWLAGLVVSFKQENTPVVGWIGGKLAKHEFDSYFNRAVLVAAVGLLFPFLKWNGVSRGALPGIQPNPLRAADVVAGFALAAVVLGVTGLVAVRMGAYTKNFQANWDATFSRALTSAAGASLVEEWIFRGAFLGVALRAARPWTAILAVSALFSILHLLQAPDLKNYGDRFAAHNLGWHSGFEMIGVIFQRNLQPALFVSEFLTLFALGVILAWARWRTASLWLSVGLHAGLVFAFTLFNGATRTSRALRKGEFRLGEGDNAIPLIGENLKIGLLPLGALVIVALLTGLWLKLRARKLHALSVADG